MELPVLKKGDLVIPTALHNGQYADVQGCTCEVTQEMRKNINYIKAKALDGPREGSTFCLYYSGPADEFIPATREAQIEWRKKIIADLEMQIAEHEKEIEFLEKYADEAEFVADKIDQLLKADGVGAKAAILRELKKSHYI